MKRVRTKRYLRQASEPSPAGVRGVVANRLDHQVRIESCLVQCFFHQTKSLHGNGGIELAVHPNDIGT